MTDARTMFSPLTEAERARVPHDLIKGAAASSDADRVKISHRLWTEAAPEHPMLDTYLARERGIPKPPGGWGDTLRLHDSLPDSFVIGVHHPAVLMRKTSPAGDLVGLHAVFLAADGRKAVFEDAKKSAKKSLGTGGVVVLRAEGSRLLVAEGPEDALMAAAADLNAAALCTAGAGTLPRVADHPPDGCHEVVLLAQR